jgi:hypothetical protein
MKLILLYLAFVALNTFGQDLTLENQSKDSVRTDISQKTLYDDWLIYATNNPYIKDLIRQKFEIDSQINVLQNQRQQFIAEDHYNTYTNTPYLIIDEMGHNRVYASREAYDNEIIGGLIKLSLNINNEIIQQKNLYFAAHGSNTITVPNAKLCPPSGLKVVSE